MLHLLLLVGLFSLGICLPRQYHFIDQNKTWAEAQRYCRENYVDLVSINSIEEQLAVTDITATWKRRQSWVGLYDDLNSWKWSLDDDSFYKKGERSFRNWYINKAWKWNRGNICVYFEVHSAAWGASSCSSTLPFICFDGRANASESYILVEKHMNWTEAQRYCRKHYTDLSSVRNENENQKIGLLPSNDYGNSQVWIGLYKNRSWSDKSNSSFSYWCPEEPFDYAQGGYCTAVSFISLGKCRALNCSQAFPFLCYSAALESSRKYHFINDSKTWIEAQRYCRENFTDLATIDNMDEMSTLLKSANETYSGLAWIGLYDHVDSWRWSLGDNTFYQKGERDFRGWEQQPDNSNRQELCVSMNPKGEWFDMPCIFYKPFVCYNGRTNTYVAINMKMTWNEAQSYCRTNHRDLASVRNEMELQQIMNVTTDYDVWIGLYRNLLWSDQSNLSYTNWKPNIHQEVPFDKVMFEYSTKQHLNRHCTSVDPNGTWIDEYCLASLPFICYSTFTPGAVMGLQLKIKAIGNPSDLDIRKMLWSKLKKELSIPDLPRNIVLNVRNIYNLSPWRDVSYRNIKTQQ